MNPKAEVNDPNEEPSEFVKDANDVAAAMTDAVKRGDRDEAQRLREELDELNRQHVKLNEEEYGRE